MVRLGEVVPGFSADSSTGQLDWHAYIDNSWAVLFSHPVRAQGRGQGGVGVSRRSTLRVVLNPSDMACGVASRVWSSPPQALRAQASATQPPLPALPASRAQQPPRAHSAQSPRVWQLYAAWLVTLGW